MLLTEAEHEVIVRIDMLSWSLDHGEVLPLHIAGARAELRSLVREWNSFPYVQYNPQYKLI